MATKHYAVILLSLSVLKIVLSACDLEWAEFEGKCYHFSRDTQGWREAQRHCKVMDAVLVSDETQDIHDFLTGFLSVLYEFRETSFWIGAEDGVFEGTWRWLKTGAPVGPFSKWTLGSPTGNKTRNCVAMTWQGSNLVWEDRICEPWRVGKTHGGSLYYICEKPMPGGSGTNVIG